MPTIIALAAIVAAGLYGLYHEIKHPMEASSMLARRCIVCHEPCSEEDAWRIRNGATVISGLCGTCRESASL